MLLLTLWGVLRHSVAFLWIRSYSDKFMKVFIRSLTIWGVLRCSYVFRLVLKTL